MDKLLQKLRQNMVSHHRLDMSFLVLNPAWKFGCNSFIIEILSLVHICLPLVILPLSISLDILLSSSSLLSYSLSLTLCQSPHPSCLCLPVCLSLLSSLLPCVILSLPPPSSLSTPSLHVYVCVCIGAHRVRRRFHV